MRKFLKSHFGLILVLAISVITFSSWLSSGIFVHSNWAYVSHESQVQMLFVSAWDNSGYGQFNLNLWRGVFQFLFGILGFVGFSTGLSDSLLVFWPIIILVPSAAYLLARDIFPRTQSAFVAALIFSFNTYYLSIATQGHILLTVAAAFGIFSLLFFQRFLSSGLMTQGILAVLSLSVCCGYDLRIGYITAFLLFVCFLFRKYLFKSSNIKIQSLASLFTVFVFLNLFWLIPFISSGSLVNNPWLVRGLFGNNFWTLSASITLFHPFWTGNTIDWFIVHPVPALFWSLPILACLGLLLNRRNSTVLFFGAV